MSNFFWIGSVGDAYQSLWPNVTHSNRLRCSKAGARNTRRVKFLSFQRDGNILYFFYRHRRCLSCFCRDLEASTSSVSFTKRSALNRLLLYWCVLNSIVLLNWALSRLEGWVSPWINARVVSPSCPRRFTEHSLHLQPGVLMEELQ